MNNIANDPPRSLEPRVLWRVLAGVEPESVAWLWPGRIPLGKLTILEGDPGLGKSTLLLDLAARVTTGHPMPDGSPTERGTVVLATAEDGIADTVRPRFDAAGGDAGRLLVLDGIAAAEERPLCLPEDIALLGAELLPLKEITLVIIDPFVAYLSEFVNSRIDHDVRRTLAPLSRLAADVGCAVVLVRHLNKAVGGSAIYRGGGSIGIIGAARSGLLVAADPDDATKRVLAPTKSNLAPPAPSLSFELVSTPTAVARVAWLGTSAHAANALVASAGPEDGDALGEAKAFLVDYLAGIPRSVKETQRAAREAGIAERTLDRAKAALGVRSVKEGTTGWVWRLPAKGATPPITPNLGTLGTLGTLSSGTTTYEDGKSEGCQPGGNGALPPEGAGDAWEPEPPAPSLTLAVTDLGSGLFLVTGGQAPHEVRVAAGVATCDCPDHQYRKRACKHIGAVRGAQGVR